jgi:hypothetical protein
MLDGSVPRMGKDTYYRYLELAAEASMADEIRQLRAEVVRRWHGDPLADDLTEALASHLTRFYSGLPDLRRRVTSEPRRVRHSNNRPARRTA